jgi:hypothetical protein
MYYYILRDTDAGGYHLIITKMPQESNKFFPLKDEFDLIKFIFDVDKVRLWQE